MNAPDDVVRALSDAKSALFTSHVPPDGDGLGAGLALVRWFRATGRQAVFAAGGGVQACLRFLYEKEGNAEIDLTADGPDGEFDVVVALDAAAAPRLGGLTERFTDAARTVNIDHHVTNERFGHVNWVDPDASSTGEMIHRLFRAADITLTREIAEPLYVALVTDTGRFGFSNTTPAVHAMAADLLAAGVRPERATGEIYRSADPAWLRLQGLAMEKLRILAGGRLACITATREMIERSGADPLDVGDLVDIPISIRGVEVGVLFRPGLTGGTKLSLRSRAIFPVNDFAARYGGGGHPRAAGASLPDDVEDAREKVIADLVAAVGGDR